MRLRLRGRVYARSDSAPDSRLERAILALKPLRKGTIVDTQLNVWELEYKVLFGVVYVKSQHMYV